MKLGRNAGWLVLPAVALGLLVAPAARAGHDEDALKLMQEHKLTLAKAVETAEAASKGVAIGVQVKLEGKNGQVIVHCFVKDECMAVPVDIKTGKAEKASKATAAEEKDTHIGQPKDINKAIGDEKTTLAKAIDAAEKSHGKAVSVATKLEGGKLDFAVRVVDGGKASTVTVDAKGNVVKGDENKKPTPKPTPKPEPKKP
jgi:hypothetical protein